MISASDVSFSYNGPTEDVLIPESLEPVYGLSVRRLTTTRCS